MFFSCNFLVFLGPLFSVFQLRVLLFHLRNACAIGKQGLCQGTARYHRGMHLKLVIDLHVSALWYSNLRLRFEKVART